jgi:hypothetical protein
MKSFITNENGTDIFLWWVIGCTVAYIAVMVFRGIYL